MGCFILQSAYLQAQKEEKPELQYTNVIGDTMSLQITKKTLLVIIQEPSCTRCKDELAALSNRLGPFWQTFLMLPNSKYLMPKKVYEKYANHLFKKLDGILYALGPDRMNFAFKRPKEVKERKYPVLYLLKPDGTSTFFAYKDIFIDTHLRPFFKPMLKKESRK